MFVSNESEIVELMASAGELECAGGGHQSGPQARPSSDVATGGRSGSNPKPTVNKPHHNPSGHFSSSDVSHRQSGASDKKKNQGSARVKVRENGEERMTIAGECIGRRKRGTKARPPSGVDNRVPSGSNPQQSVGKQHHSSLGHLSSSDIDGHRQVGSSDNMERQGNTRGKVRESGEEGIQNILQEDQSILNRFTGQKHVAAVAAPRRQDVSPYVTRESQFNHELGRHMQLSKGYDHSYGTQTFQDLDSLDFDKMKNEIGEVELLLNFKWEEDQTARRRKTEIERTNGSVTNLSSTESESAVWYTDFDDPADGVEHTQEHIRRKQYSNEWNEDHENVPGQCMQLSKGYDHSYETRAFQDLDRIQNKSEEDEQQNFKWEGDQAARRRKAELKRTNGNVIRISPTGIAPTPRVDTDETLLGSLKIKDLKVPPNWPLVTSSFELTTLSEPSKEYQEIQRSFLSSIGLKRDRKLVKIQRVQSKRLWQHYCLMKHQMDRRDPHVQNERILWHGTSVESFRSICRNGFNRSFSGKNAAQYGDGVYFAPDSSYSVEDTYSPLDVSGNKYVFQARVLTGTYTKGVKNMRVPPLRDEDNQLMYDSVVDNVDTPHLFVIFHDFQAYPEYLITFK